MPNVTYTPSEPFEDASDKVMKRVITVHANGHYEDTMVVSACATDKEIAELYQRRLITAEEAKQSWGW
jgi:hypothetical protein